MSWGIITEDWRIKLLALGLAVLMLGAVAFSQNPPTTKTLSVPLNYTFGDNSSIVILNPPPKTTVSFTGLAGDIANVTPSNLTATVDATHAQPGQGQRLNVVVQSTIPITIQNQPQIVVNIDTRLTVDLPVSVNVRPAAGWSITKQEALCPGAPQPNPCVVHFAGPKSWESGLVASVEFPGQVSVSSIDSPTRQIQLQNTNGPVDLTCHTEPCALLDITTVTVHIEAVQGVTSNTVALLDSPYSHGPAPGYRVTDVTITPGLVNISGDPAALARIRTISLPPVDLTGRTADATFMVAIPYPNGVTGNVPNATVKYAISQNPNASPAP